MKKLINISLLTLFMSGGLFATNGDKPKVIEPKNDLEIKAISSPNVWAEEKIGTYRESNLGALLFGRCKKTTDLCMIIFHPGDNPAETGRVQVFPPEGGSITYKFKGYECHTEVGPDGVEEEVCVFQLRGSDK